MCCAFSKKKKKKSTTRRDLALYDQTKLFYICCCCCCCWSFVRLAWKRNSQTAAHRLNQTAETVQKGKKLKVKVLTLSANQSLPKLLLLISIQSSTRSQSVCALMSIFFGQQKKVGKKEKKKKTKSNQVGSAKLIFSPFNRKLREMTDRQTDRGDRVTRK